MHQSKISHYDRSLVVRQSAAYLPTVIYLYFEAEFRNWYDGLPQTLLRQHLSSGNKAEHRWALLLAETEPSISRFETGA